MRLKKRDTIIFFVLLSVLLAFLLLDRYYKLREIYYKDYLKHKEIMFLLANYQGKKREEPTEQLIRMLFSQYQGEFRSFRQTDAGYEVQGTNLPGEKLPYLIYALEERGISVQKLRAVDNTGRGLFEVYLLLR
jgi:hypothetical protein